MNDATDSRREDQRYSLPAGVGVAVVFRLPDGTEHLLPVVELSARGLAFRSDTPLAELEVGAMLPGAQIRLRDLEIHGHLAVLRITGDSEARCIYGAQFYPQSEANQNHFIALVGRLSQLPEF